MNNRKNVCVAADYGGTKLLVGAVTEDGEILVSKKYKTGTLLMSEAVNIILDSLDDFICTMLPENCHMSCIGVGLVGQIDHDRGYMEKLYTENVDPIPLADLIRDRWHVPCAIDNDCKCALAAEWKIGYGKVSDDFLYINVGTGLSAGFVSGGHIIRGRHNNGGEIGFTPSVIEPDCTIEEVAAGRGMIERYERLRESARLEELTSEESVSEPSVSEQSVSEEVISDITVKDIFELAQQGDASAQTVMEDAAAELVRISEILVYTFSPEYIVFGGGVMRNDWLMDRIIEKVHISAYDFDAKFVRTHLDISTIGLLGAAMVGYEA